MVRVSLSGAKRTQTVANADNLTKVAKLLERFQVNLMTYYSSVKSVLLFISIAKLHNTCLTANGRHFSVHFNVTLK